MSDPWEPGQYDRFKTERRQPFDDLLAMIEPVPGCRVVDLGCGTGELTAELHRLTGAADTLGLDSSAAMLDGARALGGDGLLAVQMPANVDHPSHTVASEIGREFGVEPSDREAAVLPPERYAADDERYGAFLARYTSRLLEVLGDRSPYPYAFKRILFRARLRG